MNSELIVFQGGGPSAVINATLAAVLETAAGRYERVWGLQHSLENAAPSSWIDLTRLTLPGQEIARATLARTPGALLGSSRQRASDAVLQELICAMSEKSLTDIIGIGGNGTMWSLNRIGELAAAQNNLMRIVGAPKTVDNDIPGVEFAPGFGSAARFVAMAVRDFDCDFRAMQTFDDVTVLETMGRNTGWLAAASTLLKESEDDAPHIVLLPERVFDEVAFLKRVAKVRSEVGRVFVVTNEVLFDSAGDMVGAAMQDGPNDALGRTMYSLSVGTAHYLARIIRQQLKLQVRCLRPGNLARAFTSSVSGPDVELAKRVGNEAVGMLDTVGSDASVATMLTINADLAFGSQPTLVGSGTQPLPVQYLVDDHSFDVADTFRADVGRMIGRVDPIIRADFFAPVTRKRSEGND